MKKIIIGVLAAFAFSLATIGVSDFLSRPDPSGMGNESTIPIHDVGLPEPPPLPPPPPPGR